MKLFVLLAVVSVSQANIFFDLTKADLDQFKNSRNFTGKVVLVTGSNSGIGEGITKLFAALGAQTVVTGRNADTVKKVAQEVEQLSPNKLKPLQVVGDLTNDRDAERLVNETIAAFGRLDVLVNNAGIGSFDTLDDKNFIQEYDTVFNTDLRTAVVMNHLTVPHLEQTNGTIIHISSIAALMPSTNGVSYAMAKIAMDMMTRCLALELGPRGIRVNTINPGATLTDSLRDSTDPLVVEIRNTAKSHAPLQRLGEVLEIAKGVVFLASSDASFITAFNLVIDGGLIYNYPQTHWDRPHF